MRGKALAHGARAQAQLVGRAGAQVLHHHVGARDQAQRRVAAGLALEVERDRALAAVAGAHHRFAVAADVARLVAVHRLDLDDAGAQFGQCHGGARPGDVLAEVDHADPGERGRRGMVCGVMHGRTIGESGIREN